MKHQIPNALTILRFLMVPAFLFYLFVSLDANRVLISLILFMIASFTDYLDGMLARKMNVISDFGKIMDPLADKLLVLSALAGLCWLPPFHFSKAIFFIVLVRELLITILREIFQRRGVIVAADKLGKLKTVMQMLGIIGAFAAWTYFGSPSVKLIWGFELWFWLVAVITLASGLNYTLVLFRRK